MKHGPSKNAVGRKTARAAARARLKVHKPGQPAAVSPPAVVKTVADMSQASFKLAAIDLTLSSASISSRR